MRHCAADQRPRADHRTAPGTLEAHLREAGGPILGHQIDSARLEIRSIDRQRHGHVDTLEIGRIQRDFRLRRQCERGGENEQRDSVQESS